MALFRGPTVGIGVDVGTSTMKVVELASVKGQVTLVTYGTVRQPNLLLGASSPDAVAQLAVVLRALLQRAKVSNTSVAAALPVLSAFSTVVELPAMPERELETAVTFAAKNYVPSPLKDVVLGWTPIAAPREADLPRAPAAAGVLAAAAPAGPPAPEPAAAAPAPGAWLGALVRRPRAGGDAGARPGGKPEVRKVQDIFLTAAPRDLVTRYTQLFERVGVTLAALEVESFPLVRSLLAGEREPVLLVDLGDRTTSFSVVDERYLRVNQAMDTGGTALTEAIAAKTGLPTEEAEGKKQREGLTGGDESPLTSAMRPVLTEIIQRGEALRRLYERKRTKVLRKVILIGGGSRLLGLTAFWTSLTGVPTELGNPWRGIAVPTPLTERLRTLGPSFAVAVGLALRPLERT